MVREGVIKGVVFYIKDHAHNQLPEEVFWLMKEFRLMVNKTIRTGDRCGLTSRFALCKAMYKGLREEHDLYSQYIPSACEVAGAILKNYRKRLHKGLKTMVPYATRLYLKCENQTYHLDRKTGVIRLPIRAGKHVMIELEVSDYHRRYLDDEKLALGSMTITPKKIVIAFRKKDIKPFVPETVISLDTNERSLDGVLVANDDEPVAIRLDTSDVPVLQERHHERRRRLQRKKAHDRRMKTRLCGREGKREHDRIEDRLYKVAKRIVSIAKARKSAIVLEDLTGLRHKGWSKTLNRRLSSWPRRRLHEIILHMARWEGVPVIFVDPWNTSNDCPICRRHNANSRMDSMFRCECGWECDEHLNASLNIFLKAVASSEAVARAVQGRPDASWHDLMMSPYDLFGGARTEQSI